MGTTSSSIHNSLELQLSEAARNAFRDLKALGYDTDALARMNLNDERIIELRDKSYRYRGVEPPKETPKKDDAEFTRFFGLCIDLTLKMAPDQARVMARHLFYLAERELSQY
ncbi:MAG: hypothetical protein ACREA4_12890 [Nitrososphaera sp.]